MKDITTTELRHTFKLIIQNKLNLLVCSVADIIFFILYGFFTAPIYQKLVQYTNIIGALTSETLKNLAREQESLSMILFQDPIKPYFTDLLLLLLLLGATTFMLYVLFQGFVWKTALEMTGKKIRYLDYLRKFIKVNVIWFLFFVIYYFGGFAIEIRNIAVKTFTDLTPSNALSIVLTLYLIVIMYFAVISYTDLGVRKSFRLGTKKIKKIIPAVLIIALSLLFINFILSHIMKANFYAGLVLGLITLIPAFTIARVYISLVVQKIK